MRVYNLKTHDALRQAFGFTVRARVKGEGKHKVIKAGSQNADVLPGIVVQTLTCARAAMRSCSTAGGGELMTAGLRRQRWGR